MIKCCCLKLHDLRIAQPLCMYCQNEHPCMEFKQSLSVSVHCALWPEFPFFVQKLLFFLINLKTEIKIHQTFNLKLVFTIFNL